jgi:signal transduction histidine kinase
MRSLIFELRPAGWGRRPVATASIGVLRRIRRVEIELVTGERRLPPKSSRAVPHRAEALNNALSTRRLTASTSHSISDRARLTVHDDGGGFDPASAEGGRSAWLTSMRERASAGGGYASTRRLGHDRAC